MPLTTSSVRIRLGSISLVIQSSVDQSIESATMSASTAMTATMSAELKSLLTRAMIGLDEENAPASGETGWRAIVRLQKRASHKVFDACLSACTDPDPLKRRVAAIVLGEFGHSTDKKAVFGEERYRGLMARSGGSDRLLAGSAEGVWLLRLCGNSSHDQAGCIRPSHRLHRQSLMKPGVTAPAFFEPPTAP